MNGIIVLDKPAGISSARAVDVVKRLLPRGTKIGHAGTLDPFATGVLMLLVGRSTRQCESLMSQPKGYDATVKLGATTETLDPESPELPREVRTRPQRSDVERVLAQFRGTIMQRPPAFSAMKVAGRRAYDLARCGKPPVLEARPVTIHSIELTRYDWPIIDLSIECGRGTYIRSIARDLGEALGGGGYLTQLRRTRVGAFDLAKAVTLEQLRADGVSRHLLHPSDDPYNDLS
jgi:tRNA pseudouridine55 synthase